VRELRAQAQLVAALVNDLAVREAQVRA